jgi:hypothetical protein
MRSVRSRTAALAAVLALVAAGPGASVEAAPAGPHAVASKACHNGTIDGSRKHLCRGQFCKRGSRRQYTKYGFSCSKRDRNGRYHLR